MARFKPGESGNPKGRPPGPLKRNPKPPDVLWDNRDALFAKAVELGLAGDVPSLKMCIDRLRPPLKSRDEPIVLPFEEDATLVEKGNIILLATSAGELSADVASRLLQALASQAKLIETEELVKRIEALEQSHVKS